jgi:hypothetical protein
MTLGVLKAETGKGTCGLRRCSWAQSGLYLFEISPVHASRDIMTFLAREPKENPLRTVQCPRLCDTLFK